MYTAMCTDSRIIAYVVVLEDGILLCYRDELSAFIMQLLCVMHVNNIIQTTYSKSEIKVAEIYCEESQSALNYRPVHITGIVYRRIKQP